MSITKAALKHKATMKTRKSQMEIMGLVIIIALIMIGLLFVIRFTILSEPKSLKKSFKEKEMISNFVNAMRLTTVRECRGASVEQLLIDCGDDGNVDIRCEDDIIATCDDLKEFIDSHFVKPTLDEWGVAYTLSFKDNSQAVIMSIAHTSDPGMKCNADNIGRAYTKREFDEKPIPLGNGRNMFIDMELCS